MVQSITAMQLSEQLAGDQGADYQLVDVRDGWELDICKLPEVVTIPMQQIPARMKELSTEKQLICICHHGARSLQVAEFLLQNGFDKVTNLDGGMDSWARTVDQSIALY
ncbi:MAG: hypothetical protein JKY89_11360 [Immundisolibacteraceae bacterium]|nr:hypothetical protein [Immundisolibacteraceae bacterium]